MANQCGATNCAFPGMNCNRAVRDGAQKAKRPEWARSCWRRGRPPRSEELRGVAGDPSVATHKVTHKNYDKVESFRSFAIQARRSCKVPWLSLGGKRELLLSLEQLLRPHLAHRLPWRLMRWALWTLRSSTASATVGS
jgi:hypothetical protein